MTAVRLRVTSVLSISSALERLTAQGRPPTRSRRLSPLLQAVAVGAAIHPRLADLAMRLAPPTHRLTYWRSSDAEPGPTTSSR